MEKYLPYAVLLLRLALAFTLLAIVADKFGYWGEAGTPGTLWGDWDTYAAYFGTLVPFLPGNISEKLAIVCTFLEIALAIMLLFGLKVRWAAVATCIYTLLLGISMAVFISIKASFDHSLFVCSAAGFLLACCPIYKFTRHGIKKRSTYHPY
ncbi:DoxX family membrane protein [Pontibacter sp. Tf4]|uniref:DoxX family membrane protein n=1 Tax=Pontibacter sp. Tf4 TaxID=2761620 RepID=UPI00162335BC|nr:DoxX family membrane protein [Pontibacter sp. Tf4]MBB6612542.1 DoxX family membrane protein [Pontibacter sp. Tf4]